jgi:hypothetical protein
MNSCFSKLSSDAKGFMKLASAGLIPARRFRNGSFAYGRELETWCTLGAQ